MGVRHVSIGNVLGTVTFIGDEFKPSWINSLVPGGWSVTVEMMFYLFVPFLYKRINTLSRAVVMTVVTLVFGVITDSLLWHFGVFGRSSTVKGFLYFWFPSQISIFSLGFVLFHWLKPRLTSAEQVPIAKASSVAWVMILISVFVMVLTAQIGTSLTVIQDFMFGIAFFILAYGLSVYPVRPFVNKIWSHIGTISFSMYLTHFLFVHGIEFLLRRAASHHLVLHGIGKFVIMYAVVVALTIPVSTVTYRFIEQPFVRLGSKLIDTRRASAPDVEGSIASP